MLTRYVLSFAVLLGFIQVTVAQRSSAPQPYADKDAYDVYNALLATSAPDDSTIAIQQETVTISSGPDADWGSPEPESCMAPETARVFKDAISDYDQLNTREWLLQRKFARSAYEILDSKTTKILFQDDQRENFYKRFPGGHYVMSAVGFSKDRQRAIVFFGHTCGDLCGAWSLHLLEKSDGRWHEVDGVTCVTVS